MTDAEYRRQKARVRRLVTRWSKALGLGYWDLTVAYARDDYEDRAPGTGNVSMANCAADWRYLHATITFNMPMVALVDDAKLESVVVHELAHVLINETRESDDWLSHEERVASTLAKAFLWATDVKNGVVHG